MLRYLLLHHLMLYCINIALFYVALTDVVLFRILVLMFHYFNVSLFAVAFFDVLFSVLLSNFAPCKGCTIL